MNPALCPAASPAPRCCLPRSVRGDLIRILHKLLGRKKRFDAILIETTGLADPAPVAQTFFVDEELKASPPLPCPPRALPQEPCPPIALPPHSPTPTHSYQLFWMIGKGIPHTGRPYGSI